MPAPEQSPAKVHTQLFRVTAAVALTIMIGYLLHIGQSLLVPIVVALIFVYIVAAFDQLLAEAPLTRHLPQWLRSLTLYVSFIAVIAGFAALITSTVQQLVAQAPTYQDNILAIFGQLASLLHIEKLPDWNTLRNMIMAKVDLQLWLGHAGAQLSSAGGTLLLIIVYVAFLAGERTQFASKLAAAFPDPARARRTQAFIEQINAAVGNYLGTKTLVNIILGVISYAILLAFGLDYAAFWALLIAVLNYIPYFGSIVAVLLPTLLSVVQFASWPRTIGLLVLLQVVQMIIGYIVEPKMVGKTANLSAFVVMVALSFWSAVWGLTGAVLAVPLTSILVLIFMEIPSLRPLAILMSQEPSQLRMPPIKVPGMKTSNSPPNGQPGLTATHSGSHTKVSEVSGHLSVSNNNAPQDT